MQRRGQYIRDIKKDEFDSKLLDLARVTHVRAGGKRLRFRAVVVVGEVLGDLHRPAQALRIHAVMLL